MKAYKTIRFVEYPDRGDLRADGRSNDGIRPVFRDPRAKAATRRYLKRRDRARMARFESETN